MANQELPPPGAPPGPSSSEPAQKRAGWRHALMLLLALSAALALVHYGTRVETDRSVIDYSTFYTALEQGLIERVVLRGQTVHGTFREPQRIGERDQRQFRTSLPAQEDPELLQLMREKDVKIAVEADEGTGWWQVLAWMLPWLLFMGAWLWLSRRAQSLLSSGSPMSGVLKAQGRRFEKQSRVDVTFDDVAGLKSAKRDLTEIVEFLGHPERFQRLGGKLPRGVLLVGAPGTGKTLLARAVAGEAGVPFFSITGSEFIELFVGVGAARVRDLFETAKKAAPSIVFIDEIDAVGRSRGTGLGGGHDEREQTLNQLLAEMDGFVRSDRVVVMAATNRPDVLDPALLRPGRFDRRVVVDLPEQPARRAILEVHTRKMPLAPDVSLDEIAKGTPGFSGADLANLANEAALGAIRRNADRVEAIDFSAAQDKIMLGDPRETRLLPEEKLRVVVHETGHAVVAARTPSAEPLRRVSIIPRGLALGATQQTPLADRHLATHTELEAKLRVLLGGYAAEKLWFEEISSGAENDLRQASAIAQKMVAQLGMSERLGPIYHEHNAEHPFLGARIAVDGGVSDATTHEIELETRALLRDALAAATRTLRENRGLAERLVQALLEHETLEQSELYDLIEEPEKELSASAPRRGDGAALRQ